MKTYQYLLFPLTMAVLLVSGGALGQTTIYVDDSNVWTEYGSNPLFGGPTKGVNRAYYPVVLKVGSTYHMWYGDGNNTRHASSTNANFSDVTFPATLCTGLPVGAYHPRVLYNASGWTIGGNYYAGPFLMYSTTGNNWSAPPRVAHSADGVSWSDIGACTGVIGGGAYYLVYNFDVLYEGGTTWKAYADNGWGWTLYYTSTDGLNWTGVATNILGAPLQPWETNNTSPHVIKVDTYYVLFYGSGGPYSNQAIGMAVSTDGQNWIKSIGNPIFSITGAPAWRNDRTYTPYVFRDGADWKMYFSGRSTSTGSYSIGYATNGGLFRFITDAINAASTGDIINVAAGTYNEHVVINKTLTLTGAGSSTIDSLTVNNASGFILSSNTTVNSALTLTSGKVTLGSNNLTLSSAGVINGESPSSYIVTAGSGKLVRNGVGTTAREFPVGTTSSYNPVTIATGSGTDNFSVRVLTGVIPTSANDPAAVQRTWDISEAESGGNGTIRFTVQWNSGEQGGTFDRTLATPWKHNGTAWVLDGTLISITPGNTYPAIATVDVAEGSLSNWTIANSDGALPIQLAFAMASVVRDNDVEVAWRTISETNNYGFELQRKRGDAGEWVKIGFVAGRGTTLEPQSYSYIDRSVPFGKYYYRIRQIDLDGKSETFEPMEVSVGVGPDKFVLAQNYPNPFNPSTVIEFAVPQSGFTTLKVYNVLGQEVAKLFEGNADGGQIYAVRFDASKLSSGMYFYSLRSAGLRPDGSIDPSGKAKTKRMLLVK